MSNEVDDVLGDLYGNAGGRAKCRVGEEYVRINGEIVFGVEKVGHPDWHK